MDSMFSLSNIAITKYSSTRLYVLHQKQIIKIENCMNICNIGGSIHSVSQLQTGNCSGVHQC